MTLDEALAEIEAMVTVCPERGNQALAPTGEPYIELLSGTTKEQGDRFPAWCASPEIAIALWLRSIRDYVKAAPEGSTLYWRVFPELGGRPLFNIDGITINQDGSLACSPEGRRALTHEYFAVYSRLLVSNKPRIQAASLPSQAA